MFDNKKAFKVRLTSKNSGKKIDINVSFKTKKVKTQYSSGYIAHFIPWVPPTLQDLVSAYGPVSDAELATALGIGGLNKLD